MEGRDIFTRVCILYDAVPNSAKRGGARTMRSYNPWTMRPEQRASLIFLLIWVALEFIVGMLEG